MRKIAVIGLQYDTNLGDPIISESLIYLLKQFGCEADITSLDLKGRTIMDDDTHAHMGGHNNNKVYELLKWIKKNSLLIDSAYFNVKEGNKAELYFKEKLRNIDVIVFAGGGIIECEHYHCHHYLNLITKIAEQNNIKIIYNAVGFNGKYKNNGAYNLLKKNLNSKCVTYISVRENPEEIAKYVNYSVDLVCDPGCWSAEAYGITKNQNSHLIGIGLVRPEVFREFGFEVSALQVEDIYYRVLLLLQQNGYEYQLFTNGTYSDYCFGKTLVEKHPDLLSKQISEPKTTEDFLEILSGYRAILCSRMHASICSYSLNIPSVALCWNEKLVYFYRNIGFSERCIHPKDFDAKTIYDGLVESYNIGDCNNEVREKFRNTILNSIDRYSQVWND